MQKYQTVEAMPKSRKELEDVNYLSQKKENKTYDINSFLEEARRNRTEKDDMDGKRKLKNNACIQIAFLIIYARCGSDGRLIYHLRRC